MVVEEIPISMVAEGKLIQTLNFFTDIDGILDLQHVIRSIRQMGYEPWPDQEIFGCKISDVKYYHRSFLVIPNLVGCAIICDKKKMVEAESVV